jgi:MFS family permease
MVAGIMITSIASGQIISRTGRYKIFLQVGFIVASISMVLLSTLTPESSYIYEAIMMVMLGLGMGVALPILNLVVQNEFEQKDLGAVTSANQLFRSLGSTIGTAVFGAVLTAGIVSQVAVIQNTAYVQTLSTSQQVSQLGDLGNANTLLTLNTPDVKARVTDAANMSFSPLPAAAAQQASETFQAQQTEFSQKVIHAFSDSLRNIFIVASGLMIVSTVAVFFIRERPLKEATPEQAPGTL